MRSRARATPLARPRAGHSPARRVGLPVMAYGGFEWSEPALTAKSLQALLARTASASPPESRNTAP